MYVLEKKTIWSKYSYGPARIRPYEYTHTVGPYTYGPNTRMVWNIFIYDLIQQLTIVCVLTIFVFITLDVLID